MFGGKNYTSVTKTKAERLNAQSRSVKECVGAERKECDGSSQARAWTLASIKSRGVFVMNVKGMVQVDSVTYRLMRVAAGTYSVVRILDDEVVGSFKCLPQLEITSATGVTPDVVMRIAQGAVQRAKTSWVSRVSSPPSAPAPQAAEPSDSPPTTTVPR